MGACFALLRKGDIVMVNASHVVHLRTATSLPRLDNATTPFAVLPNASHGEHSAYQRIPMDMPNAAGSQIQLGGEVAFHTAVTHALTKRVQ